jgi:hypothetical protein
VVCSGEIKYLILYQNNIIMNIFQTGFNDLKNNLKTGWGDFKQGKSSPVFSGLGSAVGNIAGSAISGGKTFAGSGVFDAVSQIGSMLPGPMGMAVGAGAKILGGVANAAFGSKYNDAKIAEIEDNIAALNNFQSNASSFDEMTSNWLNATQGMGFTKSDVGSDGWLANGVKKKFNSLSDQQAKGVAWVNNSLFNNLGNIKDSYMSGLRQNSYEYGGIVGTNGGLFSNGLIFIDEGGTHAENPLGGVPVGMGANGKPNLFEEGEAILDGQYSFSKTGLFLNPKDAKTLGLSGRMSFADAAKKLGKESEERPNDPISMESFRDALGKLAGFQEQERAKKEAKQGRQVQDANMFDDAGVVGGLKNVTTPLGYTDYLNSRMQSIAMGKPIPGFEQPQYEDLPINGLIDYLSEIPSTASEAYPEWTTPVRGGGTFVPKSPMFKMVNGMPMFKTGADFDDYKIPSLLQPIEAPEEKSKKDNEWFDQKDVYDKLVAEFGEVQGGRYFHNYMMSLYKEATDSAKADSIRAANPLLTKEQLDSLTNHVNRQYYEAIARADQRIREHDSRDTTSTQSNTVIRDTVKTSTQPAVVTDTARRQNKPAVTTDSVRTTNTPTATTDSATRQRGQTVSTDTVRRQSNPTVSTQNVADTTTTTGRPKVQTSTGADSTTTVSQPNVQTRTNNTASATTTGTTGTTSNSTSTTSRTNKATSTSTSNIGQPGDTDAQAAANIAEWNKENAEKKAARNNASRAQAKAGNTATTNRTVISEPDEAEVQKAVATQTPIVSVPTTESITSGEGTKEDNSWFSADNLMNMGVVGSGLQALTDTLGLTNKADYSDADRLINAARGYTPSQVSFTPITQRMNPSFVDTRGIANSLINTGNAGVRALRNSGLSRGQLAGSLLSSNFNLTNSLGKAYMDGMQQQRALDGTILNFNRETDKFNSEGAYRANAANAAARQAAFGQYMSGLSSALGMRTAERNAIDTAKSANLSGFLNNLQNLGLSKYRIDKADSNQALLYGSNGYKGFNGKDEING